MKIHFKPSDKAFFKELNEKVKETLSSEVLSKNQRLMKVKFFFVFHFVSNFLWAVVP